MTTYTFTIGGTSIPLPDAAEQPGMDYFAMAVSRRMWDGSLRQQVIAQRWRAPLRFVKLSATEYATVLSKYITLLTTAQAAVFPNGRTATVMAIAGTWSERHYYSEWATRVLYDVTFTVEEV